MKTYRLTHWQGGKGTSRVVQDALVDAESAAEALRRGLVDIDGWPITELPDGEAAADNPNVSRDYEDAWHAESAD